MEKTTRHEQLVQKIEALVKDVEFRDQRTQAAKDRWREIERLAAEARRIRES